MVKCSLCGTRVAELDPVARDSNELPPHERNGGGGEGDARSRRSERLQLCCCTMAVEIPGPADHDLCVFGRAELSRTNCKMTTQYKNEL